MPGRLAVEIANLPLKKYEEFLEKLSKQSNLYAAKQNNAVGAKAQNKYIDKQIGIAKKKDNEAQKTAKTTAKALDNSIKDIGKVKDKVYKSAKGKAGKAEVANFYEEIKKYTGKKKAIPASLISKITNAGYRDLAEACENYNAKLGANETAQETAAISKEETKQEIATLAKQKFDNIATEYEYRRSASEQEITAVNNQIALKQAKGQKASASDYNRLIYAEQEQQKTYRAEKKRLQQELESAVAKGDIKERSAEWYEMVGAINEVTNAIDESELSLVGFQNALRQLQWDTFDDAMKTVKRTNSESDCYINRISHKDLVRRRIPENLTGAQLRGN